ncbi:hypothetical protein ACSQ67_013568 [Phaseolus vulgaris]
MAFWHQIGKSKLRILCTQSQRSYIHLLHASAPKPCLKDIPQPNSVFHARPTSIFSTVRFFAAPVQFQVKRRNEEDDPSARRLNEKITASYVRLVEDDENHSIVPTFEALERAKTLKLDLVEVDKNAKPPVCKIMDFNKEMYKRREREKQRAKSKADMTLRNDVKEVRFSEKIEAKDLKNKADMIRKLMDKGYRVKCKVTGKENQDLTVLFSPLLALMEDVCFVESGPSMAKKDAYMIVRHIKFGVTKRSGKKIQNAANAMTQEGNLESSTTNPSDSVEYESHAESGFESEEDLFDGDKLSKSSWSAFSSNMNKTSSADYQPNAAAETAFLSRRNDPVSPPVSQNRYRRTDHQGENNIQSNAQVPPAVTENRYKKVEPRNRFQQTSYNTGQNNYQGPGTRDAFRSAPPPNWNRTRQAPVNFNDDTRIENNRQAFTPPGSRHSMPSRDNIDNHPSNASNTPRPGYGNFRGPNEGIPNHAGAPNTTRPPSYGNFRGPNEGFPNHAGAPNTTRPSYGTFSASNDGIPKHHSAPNTPKTF